MIEMDICRRCSLFEIWRIRDQVFAQCTAQTIYIREEKEYIEGSPPKDCPFLLEQMMHEIYYEKK